tara:strand:- start:1271 stop:1990 length:720 start_codon:yes stop_codon:yes gene_type:complete
MLYVYFGEDRDTARAKVQITVAHMLSKNPDALYFRITSDELPQYNLSELAGAQALFKSEYIVVLDELLSSNEGEAVVYQHLKEISDAAHPFFILDAHLTPSMRQKLEKYAHAMHEFRVKEKHEEPPFNTFLLTDALGERDVKKLWTLFRVAKQHGRDDEEIYGILFWMLKSIALAAQSKTAAEAGMKAYPYGKAKKACAQFASQEEIRTLITRFSLLPQTARQQRIPLEVELEKFILSL